MWESLRHQLKYPETVFVQDRDTDALDRVTLQWLDRFGVIRDTADQRTLLRIQPGKLAAYAFGYTDAARVQLCSDLIAWLFAFDDRFADGLCRFDPEALARKHREYDPVLDLEAIVVDEPFAASLQELYGRFLEHAPARWLRRLSASIRRYFRGCELETGFRDSGKTPTLEQYLGYRHGSIGVYPMLDLIELAQQAILPDALATSHLVEEGRRLSNLTLAVTNDLFSSRKESLEDESFNTVLVVARAEGLDFDAALARGVQVHDQLLQSYLDLEKRLLADATPALKKLLEGIHVWFDGNRRWSSECPRYNHPG